MPTINKQFEASLTKKFAELNSLAKKHNGNNAGDDQQPTNMQTQISGLQAAIRGIQKYIRTGESVAHHEQVDESILLDWATMTADFPLKQHATFLAAKNRVLEAFPPEAKGILTYHLNQLTHLITKTVADLSLKLEKSPEFIFS